MTLRRVADNPLVALKDDLSLALRRIQINLDTYRENPTEPAPLEMMVDAIDQIRGPLAALEHREAVALLEEMRSTILELTGGGSSSLDPAILAPAIERLSAYLEDCLFPGNRRPDAELPDTATALRQARLQSARTDAGGAVAGGVDSVSGLHLVQQTLKELRQIVADTLDGAPDHPESWDAVRGRLQLLHLMVAERNWTQVGRVLGRLSPIIDRLAGGAAEHYGVLACGVCNEILAGLGYCLEPLNGGGPAPAVVLNKAEEHLNQLATLLNLSDLAETPPVELISMVPGLAPAKPVTPDVAEPAASDWPEVPALPAERADVTTPDNVIAIDLPGLDFEVTLAPKPGEAPPTSASMPDLDWAATEDGSEAVATTGADLVSLIGMTETDPEFVEVFLEEAQGELATIQEQLALWRANPSDRQVQTTIRRAFHTLKGSGRMVGATVIGDFAWEFESLLNRVLDGSLSPAPAITDAVAAAVAALAPLVGQIPLRGGELDVLPALAARARELVLIKPEPARVAAIALEIDPEFVEVFLEEVRSELATIREQLALWRADPQDHQVPAAIRRAFQTLKGSGRLVGAAAIGEFAWCFENLLNQVLSGTLEATPAVAGLVGEAVTALEPLVDEAPATAEALATLTSLTARADQMSRREPVEAAEPVEPLEPVEAAGIEVPSPAVPAGIEQPVAVVAEPVSFRAMTELDQELMQVFQTEAAEILDSSDVILRRLRGEMDSVELLNDLRREMHTLKGSSRMAGFTTVGDLAHAAESVLDALGKGVLKISPLVLDHVQHALDGLHQMLRVVVGGEQPPAHQDLIGELHGVLTGKPEERPKPAVAAPAALAPHPAQVAATAPADNIRVSAALLNTLVNQMGESSIFRARIDQGVGAMSFNLTELEQTIIRLRRQVTHLATQAEARIQSRQDQGAKAHQLEFDPLELDRFTELQQVSRSLMEIADDLGNIGNTLGENTREIAALLDQQAKVNKEIQQGLMRTGMVRFGSIIPRLRRVVRQAAQELGKQAELLVGGEEAEVDRTVLENMVAPLEHMLRNSLAHGIESPELRRAAGKPDIGTITLSLRREGAELVLELGDDGGGLNFDSIRAKGLEKGLLLPGQAATQEELIALLLRPGFSTASTVTQISGRGVGMDVVNAAIGAMRGALLIQTEPGQGTRFIVRLPFSLSVTQALLVQAGDATLAIPLLSIELVTRLKESEFQVYLSGEQSRHQYSDRHYPIHNLGILIGCEHLLPFDDVKDRRPPALLFRSAEASAGLQVEAVLGYQEIIVKPIGPQFNGVPGISGATVLGDGRVVVVVDLAALVRNIGSQRQKQAESRALRLARQETRHEWISIMVIDDSITMRKVTARILERHNIQAVTAKDGLDAVAMLQTQVPDLAILDIEMPRMDGFEVVAHIRNQPHLRHLPIIMVTSRGGQKHRERAMKLGVNDYLTKPYQEEQLMQSIRKILGERALEFIT